MMTQDQPVEVIEVESSSDDCSPSNKARMATAKAKGRKRKSIHVMSKPAEFPEHIYWSDDFCGSNKARMATAKAKGRKRKSIHVMSKPAEFPEHKYWSDDFFGSVLIPEARGKKMFDICDYIALQDEEAIDPSSWKKLKTHFEKNIIPTKVLINSDHFQHVGSPLELTDFIANFWLPTWKSQQSEFSQNLTNFLRKELPLKICWEKMPMEIVPTGLTNNLIKLNAHVECDGASPSTRYSFFRIIKNLTLGEAKVKNCIFSPCSIQLALSLLANTSKESTLTKLLSFLEVENLNNLNLVAGQVFNNLIDLYDLQEKLGFQPLRKPFVSFVGGIWIDQSFPLNPYFKTVSEQYCYEWKAQVLDLHNQANEIFPEVNKWANKVSCGLISSLLPQTSLSRRTCLLLANALYFRRNWSELFEKAFTRNSKFHLLDGTCVEVPFMTTRNDQVISTFNHFKIIRLLYKEDMIDTVKNISLYIILPNEDYGIWRLLDKVGSDPLFFDKYECTPGTLVTLGRVRVPKFKITYEIQPCEILKDNGLQLPLLDEMEFYHKSHIQVDDGEDEDDCVMLGVQSLRPHVEFVADHPFLFLVRNDAAGTILLMGHVLNPLL